MKQYMTKGNQQRVCCNKLKANKKKSCTNRQHTLHIICEWTCQYAKSSVMYVNYNCYKREINAKWNALFHIKSNLLCITGENQPESVEICRTLNVSFFTLFFYFWGQLWLKIHNIFINHGKLHLAAVFFQKISRFCHILFARKLKKQKNNGQFSSPQNEI